MANEKDINKEVVQQEVEEMVEKAEAVEEVEVAIQADEVKELTIDSLREENEALDVQSEHTIFVGKNEYKVRVDEKFRETKRQNLLTDMVDFINEGNNRIELLDVATPYTSLLLIKHFTSVDVPDDIDEAIEVLNALVDLGILGDVLELLPEHEVQTMYEKISASIDRMNKNIEEMREEAQKMFEKVENKEVKEMLDNGKKQ